MKDTESSVVLQPTDFCCMDENSFKYFPLCLAEEIYLCMFGKTRLEFVIKEVFGEPSPQIHKVKQNELFKRKVPSYN